MSDDLVKRLRSEHEDCAYSPPIPTIYSEAADRIEALEKALALSAPLYSRRQIEADRDAWKANAGRLAEALEAAYADAAQLARDWKGTLMDGERLDVAISRLADILDQRAAAHTKQKDGTR